MGEIHVDVRSNPLEYIAEAHVVPGADVTLYASSDEGFVEAIFDLHRGFASMSITGTMRLSCHDMFHPEEKMDAALVLSDEELTITLEYVQRVRREVAGR